MERERILTGFLAVLGIVQLGVWIVPPSVTTGPVFALFAPPLLTTPSLFLRELTGIDVYTILPYEGMVTVYALVYLALAGALYTRLSTRTTRVVQAFLLANVVLFLITEFSPFVEVVWGRTVAYVLLMGLGLSLTTGFGGLGSLRGEAPAPPSAASSTAGDGGAATSPEPTVSGSGSAASTGGSPANPRDGGAASERAEEDKDPQAPADTGGETDDPEAVGTDSDTERASIPERIPRAPTVSVDYDALTGEEPIGSGGNADVTRATLPTPEGDVVLAIKRPRMAGTLHADAVERLLTEAETWDKLDDHDHVVGVIDYDSEPLPWIAMEYMDGGHLGARAGRMDTAQALWTAIAVTKGVRHAHRRGVAHLDLKPSNVLFAGVEGAWDVPKVADWGLSKHLLDHSNSVEGMSVEYAAPEQFDGSFGPTDDITDVYQLGAVFYELFTGRPPFEGKPFEVLDKVKTGQPTPPSEVAAVPSDLDDILLQALSTEKADRYESVLLLRNDLQALFDQQ
jgi:hypothetical protein